MGRWRYADPYFHSTTYDINARRGTEPSALALRPLQLVYPRAPLPAFVPVRVHGNPLQRNVQRAVIVPRGVALRHPQSHLHPVRGARFAAEIRFRFRFRTAAAAAARRREAPVRMQKYRLREVQHRLRPVRLLLVRTRGQRRRRVDAEPRAELRVEPHHDAVATHRAVRVRVGIAREAVGASAAARARRRVFFVAADAVAARRQDALRRRELRVLHGHRREVEPLDFRGGCHDVLALHRAHDRETRARRVLD
eukprot:30723-Pelagococcus_subviridis.AAC.15